jgi:hypothetical protein
MITLVNKHRLEPRRTSSISARKFMAYPATFHYSNDHQWVEVKDDLDTIGLTGYAQSQLHEIFPWNRRSPEPRWTWASLSAAWNR